MSGLALSKRLALRKRLALLSTSIKATIIPPPPQVFQFGVTLAGADLTFPNWTSLDEMTYAVNRITKLLRITIGWSHMNWFNGIPGAVGIQFTPFTDLDAGYLANLLTLLNNAKSLGATVMLDLHMFGGGPGLSGPIVITQITSVGTLATVTYSSVAGAPLVDGATVDIEGVGPTLVFNASPYNGQHAIFNVTPTTFQYTMGSDPGVSPAPKMLSGGVPISNIVGGEVGFVGTPRVPTSALADLWVRIQNWLVANNLDATVRLKEIMNEWTTPDFTVPTAAGQVVTTALRAIGDTSKLVFDGNNFSSGWNWLDNSNDSIRTIVDPLNNYAACPHGYADWQAAGQDMSYADNLATPGQAPPGLNTNPLIMVQRAQRQYAAWAGSFGVNTVWGEFGISSDNVSSGGNNDFADWNVIFDNWLSYVQPLGWTVFWWAMGQEFGPGYAFQLSPSSATDANVKDYSGFGVQPPQQVIIDKYIGYTGPQPVGYRITGPNPIVDKYAQLLTIGTPSDTFTAYYGGIISSTIHLLPYANYASGVGSAGGSFGSPSFPPGQNGLSSFTYTPTNPGIHQVGSTNDGALHDVAPAAKAWVREAPNPSGAVTFPIVGVNLEGMEAQNSLCIPAGTGPPLPGAYRLGDANYNFYRGFNCARVPFSRSRIQPRLFGALDTGNTYQFHLTLYNSDGTPNAATYSALQALDASVSDITQSGLTCMLDMHDFGASNITIDISSVSVAGTTATCTVADTSIINAGTTMVLGANGGTPNPNTGFPSGTVTIVNSTTFTMPVPGGTPSSGATTGLFNALIGSAGYSNAAFADAWGKIAARYVGNPKIIIDLQNEPNALTAAAMNAGAQSAITTIRAAGFTGPIMVEGGGSFANAPSWISTGAADLFLTLTDPLNNLIAQVHCYVDANFNGSSPNPAPAGSGIASLISCTDYARVHGKKLFLGEFGISTVAGLITEASAQLDHISANPDVWVGWAAWTTSPYIIRPPEMQVAPFQFPPPGGTVTDQVQLQALMNHSFSSFYAAAPTGINMNWVPGFDGGFIPASASVGTVLTGPMLGLIPNIDVQGVASFALVSNPSSMFSINGSKQLVLAQPLTDHTTYPITISVTTARGATATFGVNVICESITTFDPAQCSSDLTLSGSNLIVTRNAGSGTRAVRLTKGRTGGLPVYFEFLPSGAESLYFSRIWDKITGTSSPANFDGFRGEINISLLGNGGVFSQGAFHNPTPGMPTWGTGGIRNRVVWRPAEETIFLAVGSGNFNNNASANPSTNVGGISYATAGSFVAGTDAWFPGYNIFAGGNSAQFFMDPATWAFALPSGCGAL